MSGKPVLGIACCNRQIGEETGQAVMNRFVFAALPYAEAAGLLVPATPNLFDAADVAPRLDGLLLTGSPSNVGAERYEPGAVNAPGPFDRGRDEMTKRLIDAMVSQGKPVFGICRGFQEINVAFGGTLNRSLAGESGLIVHHAGGDKSIPDQFEHRHLVNLTPGGLLRSAYGIDAMEVISVHFQGAMAVGVGLQVEACAPDGVVEAVSARVNGARILAVQWHPEWDVDRNPQSRLFFALLGRALRGDAPA